jgi:hypothetical protein
MTFRPDRIQSLAIGFRAPALEANEPLRCESTPGRPADGDPDGPALLLTGDGQYVEVAATLQFAIDPADPDAPHDSPRVRLRT